MASGGDGGVSLLPQERNSSMVSSRKEYEGFALHDFTTS